MQINLTGFLNGRNARSFMGELWDLLVSAQESVTGIPEAFLQQKKDQIKKRLVIIHFHIVTFKHVAASDLLNLEFTSIRFYPTN